MNYPSSKKEDIEDLKLLKATRSEKSVSFKDYLKKVKKLRKKLYLLLTIMCFMNGCFSVVPPNNAPFANTKALKNFAGLYDNIGIRGLFLDGSKMNDIYLSALLWPNDKTLDHKNISYIHITVIKQNILSIKAIELDTVKKATLFHQDKDFTLSSGKISFKNYWGVPSPIIGIGHKNSTIGIDTMGNAKYSENITVTGLLALLIPIYFHVSEEVCFQRL